MKRYRSYLIVMLSLLSSTVAFSQNSVNIYSYKMDVSSHPDYYRHYVKAPTDSVFGNKIHFISLRNLTGDGVKERIDLWVNKLRLGDVLWPAYPFIYEKNLKETVAKIKKDKLFLFDPYGFIPGSGPGGYWQQFNIPAGVLEYFQSELGDHWLGMDNGEQDGRYIGSFAPRLYPMSASRMQQYFNFQRHFEAMGNQLGNKMATLVSLNYGHYFLKEGLYTLIGAETAQGLPNSQIYYSYIRGAGKQYGVHWFGNASIYNRWGWKSYNSNSDEDSGPTKGTSLSLLKRLIYTHLFYNCSAVGFESEMTIGDKLSPIGHIQFEASKWNDRNGNMGTMYTPVALLNDFYSGWTFPRHLYSGQVYRVWGNLPYEASDYLTDNVLNLFYPGYQDASFYHDERGFIAPTPYGDIADCLLSDAPLWLMRQYQLIIVSDELKRNEEVRDKLESYVKGGGHLILTAGMLKNMSGGIAGFSTDGTETGVSDGIEYNGNTLQEQQPFALMNMTVPLNARILQRCGNKIAAAECTLGKGLITVIASPFGVGYKPQCNMPVTLKEDKPLDKPFPLLKQVEALMKDAIVKVKLFDVNEELSWTVCVNNKNEYNLLVTNSSWKALPLNIHSRIGKISSIKEMRIEEGEVKAAGYTPEVITNDLGVNTTEMIAGGSVRAFRIRIDHPTVNILPQVSPTPNAKGRALVLRDIKNLKEEILARPTFFEHYDRAVVDWRYVENRDVNALRDESGWLNRQKLGITVDLTSGLNLYPDLRIVANDTIYYPKSMDRIKKVMDKMKVLGADKLLITSQRSIENNFSKDRFEKSLVESFQKLADYAKEKGIDLLYRPSYARMPDQLPGMIKVYEAVNRSNFYLTPSMTLLLKDKTNLAKNMTSLKSIGVKYFILSPPENDMHGQITNTNLPIFKYDDSETVKEILHSLTGVQYIMDGLYASPDEEYRDVKVLDNLK